MKEEEIVKLKEGDVLYASWGYDQTNIEFYQIVKKTPKAFKIRELNQKVNETGFMCGTTTPVINDFLEENNDPKIARVYKDKKSEYRWITGDSKHLYIYDGKPQYCSSYA